MGDVVSEIVAGLTSGDRDAEQSARERLKLMSESGQLGGEQAAALIDAAAAVGPGEHEWSDPCSKVLWAARDITRRAPSAQAVQAVVRVFPRLRPGPRAAALQVLTNVATVDSARAYAELVRAYAADIEGGGPIAFGARDYGPHYGTPPATAEMAAALFPAVLEATREPGLRHSLYLMLLEFLEEGKVRPEMLVPHEAEFVRHLAEEQSAVREHQRENVPGRLNWKYEPPYSDHRDLAALLLDIAGWWTTDAALGALDAFADVHDPWLRTFRAVSLLRAGRRIPAAELDWIARSARERFVLHRKLTEMGKGDDVPEVCRDQAKLAEGHMVDWLCFGTELGREPDEIELVHVETRRTGGGLLRRGKPTDYFFFRFRVTEEHWSKDRGWTVGMAGGYHRTEGGTTLHDGRTFSMFNGWEEKTLPEHVADYLE
jgi:hypothetical protein